MGVVLQLWGGCRRTSEMHRTQDSYESVSCNCRAVCSLGAIARAWGVGDLGGRSAAILDSGKNGVLGDSLILGR